jgi:hypothetical protein
MAAAEQAALSQSVAISVLPLLQTGDLRPRKTPASQLTFATSMKGTPAPVGMYPMEGGRIICGAGDRGVASADRVPDAIFCSMVDAG